MADSRSPAGAVRPGRGLDHGSREEGAARHRQQTDEGGQRRHRHGGAAQDAAGQLDDPLHLSGGLHELGDRQQEDDRQVHPEGHRLRRAPHDAESHLANGQPESEADRHGAAQDGKRQRDLDPDQQENEEKRAERQGKGGHAVILAESGVGRPFSAPRAAVVAVLSCAASGSGPAPPAPRPAGRSPGPAGGRATPGRSRPGRSRLPPGTRRGSCRRR